MNSIVVAGVLVLITHLGISSTPARDVLVRALTLRGYLAAYSLLAVAALGYLIWSYLEAPRTEYYWLPDPRLYWVPKVLMMLATVLLVGGFMVRNPTTVGMEAALGAPVTGMNRITRHPFQWAVVIWATSHIVANGDEASVPFFATFLLLSLAGAVLIDRKKRALGGAWEAFAAKTSNVPFAAIAGGRNTLEPRELIGPVVAGAIAYVAIFWAHEWLSGVPVFW